MHTHLRAYFSPRRGLVVAFVCLSLARGALYSIIVPPWQAPDEPRHLEQAILVSRRGPFLTREDQSLELQTEILSSMRDFDFWGRIGRDQPEPLPRSFSQDRFLVRSGTGLSHESPLNALMPALIFRWLPEDDLLSRLYTMRWWSVIFSAASVAVAFLVAFELFRDDRFLLLAIPSFVALLPMFTFIGASASNDALAVLVASLVIWQLLRMLNRPLSLTSAICICALTLLAVLAKRTAWFTAPLVLVAIPLHLWGRASLSARWRYLAASSVAISALLAGALLTWRGHDAADWIRLPGPEHSSRSKEVATSGRYSLRLNSERAMQPLPFNDVRALRGKTVGLHAWIISPNGPQRGSLLLADDEETSVQSFLADETWRKYSVTHTVSPRARSMRVILSAASASTGQAADLYFDDLALRSGQGDISNLLQNASAEDSALRVQPRLQYVTRYVALGRLLDGRSYDLESAKRYLLYGLLTFAGFWANFGWLTLPLHPIWYALLAVVATAAVAGLGLWAMGLLRRCLGDRGYIPSNRDRALLLLLLAFVLIVVQTFIPMIGSQWQPQGRHLFPGLIPIATLFAFGLRRLLRSLKADLLAAAYVASFVLFDALCLLRYVIPHYYG